MTDTMKFLVKLFFLIMLSGSASCKKITNNPLDAQAKIGVSTDQLLCYNGDATFNINTENSGKAGDLDHISPELIDH